MEALIPLIALVLLGLLALRFGADSRPSMVSDEHRLARSGVTWEPANHAETLTETVIAETGPAPEAAGPVIRRLVWAQADGASTRYPTLRAIDAAREPGHPAFATDPDAALLEQRARQMTDHYWSEHVWLTGLVDRSRFEFVCDTLERERQAGQRIAS